MYIDSHCHLHFPELISKLDEVLDVMEENQVSEALSVCVDMESFGDLLQLANRLPHVYASVGVHPNHSDGHDPSEDELVHMSKAHKVIAIGETGLDYFRLSGDSSAQQNRFRRHIRAAVHTGKPLIIHTRQAADDTIQIMKDERAGEAGGVMHCFTEDWSVASRAMDLGFFISFSGIVSFKNATQVREVAQKIPLDRMLIETDAPYLAPVPFRGKLNQPGYVRNVAEAIAVLRGIPVEDIARATRENFWRLFRANSTMATPS
jgi:TatD DNase family protein